MHLKRLLAIIAATALIATAAAQDYSDNSGGGNTAEQTQTITIDIPQRVALHLTDTSFELDLDDLEGKDCRLVPKGTAITGFLQLEGFAESGMVVENYPAAIFDESGNVATNDQGEYLKGTLVCSNVFVVQKFSNAGWEFSANVDQDEGSGVFGLIDRADGTAADGQPESDWRYLLTNGGSNLTLAWDRNRVTGGWLDDEITQLFWFDGSETPGPKTISVEYVLTGRF